MSYDLSQGHHGVSLGSRTRIPRGVVGCNGVLPDRWGVVRCHGVSPGVTWCHRGCRRITGGVAGDRRGHAQDTSGTDREHPGSSGTRRNDQHVQICRVVGDVT